jgi:hypothetical protein
MMEQRVLVCGGRDYSDRRYVYEVLDAAHAANPIIMLIAGGANGADALAVDWARMTQVPQLVYPADWEKHGRKAGPLRNQQMLDEGKPHMVIAFPGGRGTADMVKRADAAGVPVVRITR